MVTLYYQLCVNSQIYTDFVQVFTLNLCSTSWSRSYRPCFPFAKGKRLEYSFNWNFYLPTHFSGQLRDYRISFIQAGMTTRILRVLKNWNGIFFFFVTLWLRFDNWHGDKDRALSWVVSLLTVRCQTGQNFSMQFLISPSLLSPALACLRARPKPPCCVQVTSSSSSVTVCSAGRDIAENADKGMEVCRHGIVRLFVSVILCRSLSSSFLSNSCSRKHSVGTRYFLDPSA